MEVVLAERCARTNGTCWTDTGSEILRDTLLITSISCQNDLISRYVEQCTHELLVFFSLSLSLPLPLPVRVCCDRLLGDFDVTAIRRQEGETYPPNWPYQPGDFDQDPMVCRAASDFLVDDERFKSCTQQGEREKRFFWQPKHCDMDFFHVDSFFESIRNK